MEGSVLGLHVPVAEALDPTGGAGVVDILDAPHVEVSVVPEAAISVNVILRSPVFACVVVILDVSALVILVAAILDVSVLVIPTVGVRAAASELDVSL